MRVLLSLILMFFLPTTSHAQGIQLIVRGDNIRMTQGFCPGF